MSKTAVFITHRARPGKRDQVVAIWEEHFKPVVESIGGHDAYFYCLDDQDPDVIRVFQQYPNPQAQEKVLAAEGYAQYQRAVEPLLESTEVSIATPMWILPSA